MKPHSLEVRIDARIHWVTHPATSEEAMLRDQAQAKMSLMARSLEHSVGLLLENPLCQEGTE